MRKLLPCMLLIVIVSACNESNKDFDKVNDAAVQEMPEEMPSDFGFSIQFGIGKSNEIDTFNDTVTKDLIEGGTVTVAIALVDEEMTDVYEKMKEINIVGRKKLIPEPINGTSCEQEPYEEDEWKIMISGETITHSVSGTYCEPTSDAKQLLELRNFVWRKVIAKEKYRALPESKGGYE